MVQFLSIFLSWISSIFVGFFKSSRFFCVTLYFTKCPRVLTFMCTFCLQKVLQNTTMQMEEVTDPDNP